MTNFQNNQIVSTNHRYKPLPTSFVACPSNQSNVLENCISSLAPQHRLSLRVLFNGASTLIQCFALPLISSKYYHMCTFKAIHVHVILDTGTTLHCKHIAGTETYCCSPTLVVQLGQESKSCTEMFGVVNDVLAVHQSSNFPQSLENCPLFIPEFGEDPTPKLFDDSPLFTEDQQLSTLPLSCVLNLSAMSGSLVQISTSFASPVFCDISRPCVGASALSVFDVSG